MTLYRTALLTIAAALATVSPASAETRRYGLTGFDQVEVRGDMIVEIVPDFRLSAVADASSDTLDTLSLEVEDRRLVIQQMMEGPYGMRASGDGPVRIRLTAQNLAGVVVRGGGRVTVQGLRGDTILLVLDGPGRIDATVTGAGTIRSRASGSGTITITGRATTVESTVAGAGSVDASALTARDLTVRAAGTGTSRYLASNSARIIASGDASVEVAGRAQCTIANTGSGRVTCADGRSALSR